jgi:hypothetical protein
VVEPGPRLCCLAVHPAEPFAFYPELIREWNRSGGWCQAEDCGRSMVFTAAGQIVTHKMVDEGEAEETDFSALTSVFTLQRLRNHRLHQRTYIGGAICCECNSRTNSNDLTQRDPKRDPILEQPRPESPAFTPGGPASVLPAPPKDYVGLGYASAAYAAQAGVTPSHAYRRAVLAAKGTPVRANKGPSRVPSMAEDAASQGLSVGQLRRKRQAESEGRTLHPKPSHSRAPTAECQAAQRAIAAAKRKPVNARLFQSHDDWEPYESLTAAAAALGCHPTAIRACITNPPRCRYATVANKDRYEFCVQPVDASSERPSSPDEASQSPSPIRPPKQKGTKRRCVSTDAESDDYVHDSVSEPSPFQRQRKRKEDPRDPVESPSPFPSRPRPQAAQDAHSPIDDSSPSHSPFHMPDIPLPKAGLPPRPARDIHGHQAASTHTGCVYASCCRHRRSPGPLLQCSECHLSAHLSCFRTNWDCDEIGVVYCRMHARDHDCRPRR